MRFLIDACLSPQVAETLSRAGHDAVHVVDLKLTDAPDEEIMRRAAADRCVLISADTDFGELLARSGDKAPSLVLFRRQSPLCAKPWRGHP